MYPESLGKICSIGVFFGFNLTFLPQFVMGARGMPRRYWDYDPQYRIFHQLSTIGAYVLGMSLFITVMYFFWSFKNGKKAPRNPWGGSSLEWQCPTPPPLYNFEKPPVLHELYNYDDIYEVEEDVWERREPTETEPEEADAIAHSEGKVASHTHAAPAGAVGPSAARRARHACRPRTTRARERWKPPTPEVAVTLDRRRTKCSPAKVAPTAESAPRDRSEARRLAERSSSRRSAELEGRLQVEPKVEVKAEEPKVEDRRGEGEPKGRGAQGRAEAAK